MSSDGNVGYGAACGRRQIKCISAYFDAAVWEELNNSAPQTYPVGVEFLRQGATVREIFFIVSGLVKLTYLADEGKELILDLRPSGWLLGAASLIAQRPFPAAAITVTRCSLLRIPAFDFDRLLKTSPALSRHLHEMHSQEICNQLNRVMQLGVLSARQRLEGLLRQLISILDLNSSVEEIRLEFPLKNLEVAQLIAVTPQYLSHLFNELESEGIIHRRKGWLIIPDPRKLRPCGEHHPSAFKSLI